MPLLRHPHIKEVLPSVQKESPVFSLYPLSLVLAADSNWKDPGFIFVASSLQVFMTLLRLILSLLSPRLKSSHFSSIPNRRGAPVSSSPWWP